jgi:drug/metabolite transporter (DMT)-like permease
MSRAQAIGMLWLACLIWGAAFPITKLGLRDASPTAFALGRFFLATILVAPHLFRASRDAWKKGSVLGFLLAAGFVCQSNALSLTGAGRVAFISSFYLLLVPVILYLAYRATPDRWNLLGALLALAGIALLTRGAGGSRFNAGDGLSIVCACLFATHLVATGNFTKKVETWPLVSTQMATAGLFTALALPLLEPATFTPTLRLFGALGYQALFTSLIALRLQLTAQRVVAPSTTALVLMLQPPIASAMAFVLLGEQMTGMQWLGGGIILLGTQCPEFLRNRNK